MNKFYPRLLILFFFSGATALVYQVVWTRLLTLAFGSTTLAVSTVLTAFMGGLAIGSALLGKKADTAENPVRFYAWLELFIGLFAIATPVIFAGIEHLYIALHGASAIGFWESALLRFALSLILLLPPTIMMGGTLPVLSKYFLNRKNKNTGKILSVLYFINTIGAVTGTLLAGLYLVQALGINLLLFLSGLVNIGIFAVAYSLKIDAEPEQAEKELSTEQAFQPPGLSPWSRNAILAVVALFFSGLAALIYEVVWTRVLTLIIGSSTYAFTIMLSTFLVGIALGSALVGRLADKKAHISLLAFCQIMIGVCAIGTAAIFGVLPDAVVFLFAAVGDSFSVFLASNFLLCFLVMVPATLFMGASFPVGGAVVVEAFGSSGKRIGYLYAGNTIGAILGAFLAGFVLLPTIGIHKTLMMTILLNLSVGVVLSVSYLKEQKSPFMVAVSGSAAAFILILLFVWQPPWDTKKMMSGPYAYAREYQKQSIEDRFANIQQPFYKEGPIATVSVITQGERIWLLVDGKTDAGNFRDMTTQVFISHLPLLLKPDTEDVLIIGFASGITAGAVGRHNVTSIDNVEIEPSMEEASAFFRKENYNIVDDSRFNLIVDDARSYELTTKKKYDLLISEPSNPWQSGSSRLFTREAFENGRALLRKNGTMVQWMHLYGTSAESLRLVARTFMSVFPHTTMWMDPVIADVIFIGSDEELKIDPLELEQLYEQHPEVRESMSRIGYTDAAALMRAYVFSEEELRAFAGSGEINTDNLPYLEYWAPKSLYSSTAVEENIQAFNEVKLPESFPLVTFRPGESSATADLLGEWAVSLANNRSIPNAKGALLRATETNPDNALPFAQLGYLRMATNDIQGAVEAYENALALGTEAGDVHANIGTLYYQSGSIDKATFHLTKALELGEDSSSIRNNIAVIYANRGKFKDAVDQAQMAVTLNPNDRTAVENLERFRALLENGL